MASAISVESLSKEYRLGAKSRPYGRLTESMTEIARRLSGRQAHVSGDERRLWALRDVSFEVETGQVLGVIGRNGAGKSTLLKVLARITSPTNGYVRLGGRVGSLLEVGTGFHPELSGRENIYLNGSILGMRRVEIDQKFDEIVAFSGVERFLDTAVKHYSSGMQVRLAFAVAAHLEPEILLIDEVLSVGDAEFRRRSTGKMEGVAKSGRTVVFVSHDLGAVSDLTDRCLYLKSGMVAALGPTKEVVQEYLADTFADQSGTPDSLSHYRRGDSATAPVAIQTISRPSTGPTELGEPLRLSIDLEVRERIEGCCLTVVLKDLEGRRVAVLFSPDNGFHVTASPGTARIEVEASAVVAAPGTYVLDAGISQSENSMAYDVIIDYPLGEVVNRGAVVHWLDRPWGAVHPRGVRWAQVQL